MRDTVAAALDQLGEAPTLLPSHGDPADRTDRAIAQSPVSQGQRTTVSPALFGQAPKPQTLGRYVIVDRLGSGGMGTVLRAFDRELNRPVALKVLHEHLGAQHTQRLRREAQALATLSHPNVVQVYEVGQAQGRTFVAMELVNGQMPMDWAEQTQPDWRACVEMFIQLGEGLAAAHEQGLIHRDFKPGNAIIDDKGRARVLDFGLARRGADTEVDEPLSVIQRTSTEPQQVVALEQSLTMTGAILGTPAYMPLEQMNGKEADARSDQFSFCVSLYEVLYGERPYQGDSLGALVAAMVEGKVRPAPRGSTVPAPLRKIVLRGLASDPAERWPSIEALLEQLRGQVTPPQVRRWVAGMGLGAAAIAGLLAVQQGWESFQKTKALADQASELQREKDRAESGETQALQQLAAQQGLRAKDIARNEGRELEAVRVAVEAFESIDPKASTVPVSVFEGLTHALAGLDRGIALRGHTQRVLAVAVSPDGRRIATGSQDNTVRLWDARSGAPVHVLDGHEGEVRSVAFSPNGTVLATGSEDKTMRVWDASTGQSLEQFEHSGPVLGVAFSPDGTRLASASGNEVWLSVLDDDAWVVPLTGHTGRVRSVAWSPDGAQLYTASEDKTVRVWDARTLRNIRVLEGHTDTVLDVAVSANGTRIATGGRDKTARVWEPSTGEEVTILEPGEVVYGVALSADGTALATGTFNDGAARVWDVATGRSVTEVRHEDAVVDVAFSPKGDQLVTASWDSLARSWDLEPSDALRVLPHPRRVDAVAYSPDGVRLATASGDGRARVWDARSGALLAMLEGHRIDVLDVAYSPDGSSLATASWDGSVRLWDAESNAHQATLQGHTEPARTIVWSPDGRRVLTASRDGTARVWDAATGTEQYAMSHGAPVVNAVFSPDGERLVTVGADDRARVWNPTTGEPLADLPVEGPLTAVAFSPDGNRVAIAAKAASVSLLDSASGEEVVTMKGHTAPVRALVFSADGSQLISASEDQTARVWSTLPNDPEDRRLRAVLPHEGSVTSVAFSPDGTVVATASGDEAARIWSLEPARWLAWGCAILKGRQEGTEASEKACTRWSSYGPSMAIESPPTAEPAVATAPDLEAPETITVHGVELVLIPSGTFMMGSPPSERGRDSDETPHEVTLDRFYLARTEVTYAQYALYLEANPEATPPPKWDDERYNQPDQPVIGLYWYDAKAYCDWAGLVLPTEAQWEYAARAGSTTAYWFGDTATDLDRFGWFIDNTGAKERGLDQARARSVAQRAQNPWGLFDVHGNVWEWTFDAYEPYATGAREGDGLRKQPSGEALRVIRGGGWYNTARYARSADRDGDAPSVRYGQLGLRPALAYPQ